MRKVSCGQGYLSQTDSTVHFGLGSHPDIEMIKVIWPNGKEQIMKKGD